MRGQGTAHRPQDPSDRPAGRGPRRQRWAGRRRGGRSARGSRARRGGGPAVRDVRHRHTHRRSARHLAILGGGYIAAELADVFAETGSSVTIVEDMEHLLGPQDETGGSGSPNWSAPVTTSGSAGGSRRSAVGRARCG
ncbi:FAD-dependent oxidoreductase [Streptomyces sp. NPDC090741]|uniref:FAD-dependent oxidoreductase n=1 Tax=Streptomyces sp. NPDC090741 TaxID=3365967 RepID=UPI003819179B